MRAKLIRIGNSKGIRLPKALLTQCDFVDDVEIQIETDGIRIRPVQERRKGWDEAFQQMAEAGDDELLIDDSITTEWEEEEWEWE